MKFSIFFLLAFTATFAYGGSSRGNEIECDYGNRIFGANQFYQCKVKHYHFFSLRHSVSASFGTHKSPNSNNDVHVLYFDADYCVDCQYLHYIPQGLQLIYQYFISLSFVKCPIEYIRGNELNLYTKLRFFRMDYSNIQRIHPDFFQHTTALTNVYFNHNQHLQFVGANLLRTYNLVFGFAQNQCIQSNPGSLEDLIQNLLNQCGDNTEYEYPPDEDQNDDSTSVCNIDVCELRSEYNQVFELGIQLQAHLEYLREVESRIEHFDQYLRPYLEDCSEAEDPAPEREDEEEEEKPEEGSKKSSKSSKSSSKSSKSKSSKSSSKSSKSSKSKSSKSSKSKGSKSSKSKSSKSGSKSSKSGSKSSKSSKSKSS